MKKNNISKILATLLIGVGFTTYTYAAEETSDVRINTASPSLHFDDSGHTAVDLFSQWEIYTTSSSTGSTNYFRIKDEINNNDVIRLRGNGNSTDSFVVNTSGDIELANGIAWIDKADKHMGIGTTVPEEDLHIKNTTTASIPGPIFSTTRGTSNIKLEAFDNTEWTLGADYSKTNFGSFSSRKTFRITDGAGLSPFVIETGTATNTLVLDTSDRVGIGTTAPSAKLDVVGDIEATWSGSNLVDDGLSTLALLSANNTELTKTSDVGFGLKNTRNNFQWNFRTFAPGEGFTATKLGTGGGEFVVQSPTNDFHDAKVRMGGVLVFENGHLVTSSSRELKTNIKPLDTQAALDALHALKPVSYAYKAHKGEAVIGFIAEDVPALVAMPSRKSIDSTEIVAVLTSVVKEQEKSLAETRAEMEIMRAEIAELKGMK